MKHANPSKIDPKLDATVSTDTPNWLDKSTYPGPTIGDNAPSREAANALCDFRLIYPAVIQARLTMSKNTLLSSIEANSSYNDALRR